MSNEIPKSGMSLNIDDQKWIKSLFDRQDEVIESQFMDLAKVQQDANEKMLRILEDQNQKLARIEALFIAHESRLQGVEKYAGFWSTVGRIAIAVLLSFGLSALVFTLYEKYMK